MLIAFVVTPLIEIAVLIQIGGWLGLWPTLALIVLTAIIGTWMLRRQGFAVLSRAQKQLEEGSIPLGEVFEGFCLVVAGALLLTPGFVTDAVGGALLLPPVRAWLYRVLGERFRVAVVPNRPQPGGGPVVDGDYETVETDPMPPPPPPDAAPREPKGPETRSGPMPPPRGRWDGKA